MPSFPPVPVLAGLILLGGVCWFYSIDPPFWRQLIRDLFRRR